MDVYLGSLMLVPYNFAPKDYAFCQGQLVAIASNTALFSLLGTTYGGDGRVTFALPDLRGRLAVSQGQAPGLSAYQLGEAAGTPVVSLTPDQQPPHTHTLSAGKGGGTQPTPGAASLAQGPIYTDNTDGSKLSLMNPAALSTVNGGGQPHPNMMPYQGLNWVICVAGVFPPRS